MAHVLAEATALDPAVRGLRGDGQVVVHPRDPRLHPVTHPHRAGHVARPDRAGQAVVTVVGQPHRVVLVLEGNDDEDRPEDLALHDLAVLPGTGHQRGRVEGARVAGNGATGDHPCTGIARTRDEPVDPIAMGVRDERSDVGLRVVRVADDDLAHDRGQGVDDVRLTRAVDVHAGGGRAVLAGVVRRTEGHGTCHVIDVGVREHDGRCLAAQLQVHALRRLRGGRHHRPPGPGGPGHGHHAHVRIANEGLADIRTTGHHVQRPRREARLHRQLGEPQRAARCGRRGLDDDRVAGRQCRADLPHRHHEREVPRGDARHHADRTPEQQ